MSRTERMAENDKRKDEYGRVVMTGQLKPSDHCPGCLFVVRQGTNGNFDVQLISPYSVSLVDEAEGLSSGAVFTWLEDRSDY